MTTQLPWFEKCPECGEQFEGLQPPQTRDDNPYLKLCEHFPNAHPDKTFTCDSRMAFADPRIREAKGRDFWQKAGNGQSMCSFCFGLRFEEFVEHMRRTRDGVPGYMMAPADDPTKVYLHSPEPEGNRPVTYRTWHSPKKMSDGFLELWQRAVEASNKAWAALHERTQKEIESRFETPKPVDPSEPPR